MKYMAVSINLGVLFVGVLMIRALLLSGLLIFGNSSTTSESK